jgi:formate dehydrogenase iron-sulfur subunit
VGINRRKVVTINDSKPGERSISVACMHWRAPLMAVPNRLPSIRPLMVWCCTQSLCIGCGYCFYACPFGAPQFPAGRQLWVGKMDKCTFCAVAGREQLHPPSSRSRLLLKASSRSALRCARQALLAGDGDVVSGITGNVLSPAALGLAWGWGTAYSQKRSE